MKIAILSALFAIIIISGCVQEQATPPPVRYTSSNPLSLETFSMEYPEWNEVENNEPLNIITLTRPDNTCTFYLNSPEDSMEKYLNTLKTHVEDNEGEILTEDPLTYKITKDGLAFTEKTNGMSCNDRNYFVIFSCMDNSFDDVSYDKYTKTMKCEKS